MLVRTLLVLLALLGLVVIAFVLFAVRRRVLALRGGSFDCSCRLRGGSGDKGWAFGVACYRGDRIEWYRVFSYAPRPRRVLPRAELTVVTRREPLEGEALALLPDAAVLVCALRGQPVELAMSESALTGFLAWLESAPPGQRVHVA